MLPSVLNVYSDIRKIYKADNQILSENSITNHDYYSCDLIFNILNNFTWIALTKPQSPHIQKAVGPILIVQNKVPPFI